MPILTLVRLGGARLHELDVSVVVVPSEDDGAAAGAVAVKRAQQALLGVAEALQERVQTGWFLGLPLLLLLTCCCCFYHTVALVTAQ